MKLAFNLQWLNRTVGIGVAASILAAVSFSALFSRPDTGTVTADASVKARDYADGTASAESVVIPFNDADHAGLKKNSKKLYEVYEKLVESESEHRKNPNETGRTSQPASDTDTDSSRISEPSTQQTTVTTTVSTEKTQATQTQAEPNVSNGKTPFNYDDVSSIGRELNTLADFVERTAPDAIDWDTSASGDSGYVKISLLSQKGRVTLDVKPITDTDIGDQSGSVSGETLKDWKWYSENKQGGCNISSVSWTAPGYGIEPVRGIDVGTSLAELTDHYLCVNGGATTLYKASDVIEDQSKLNAILSAENAYTFVGGRVYTVDSYLNKYYSDRPDECSFADCDCVVQYGCNSVMEHNYTTGSWIVEYAVKDDTVTEITFMNKSYNKREASTAVSTSSSNDESLSGVTRPEEVDDSSPSEDVESKNSLSSEESVSTTATDEAAEP